MKPSKRSKPSSSEVADREVKAPARLSPRIRRHLISLLLVAVTLAAFWPVQHHEFIVYDDNDYVTENQQVQEGLTLSNLRWAFTTFRSFNWHPLTWLSHMLDIDLYGLNAGGHHWTNLLFHLLNTLLLFEILRRMTDALWPSAFTAALFAVHPLHVESVAWVAERKDVLSTFFWMLTLWAYLRYAEISGGLQRFSRYLLVLLFFTLGLMAKPMLVTLPFVMLLIDYWPLRRVSSFGFRVSGSKQSVPSSGFRVQGSKPKDRGPGTTSIVSERIGKSVTSRESDSKLGTRNSEPGTFLLLEKLPLIALSLASCVVTFLAQQRGGAVSSFERLSLFARIENALVSYVAYIVKTLWPRNLAVPYPHLGNALPSWQAAGSALLLFAFSFWVLRQWKRRPYLAVGWLWYLGTLVPVIGIIQVGGQAMADRYSYVPLIGVFIMIAWGASEWAAKSVSRKRAAALVSVLALCILAILTRIQVGYWKDSLTLFEHAIRVTRWNYVAENNVGVVLNDQGKPEEAVVHFSRALQIAPFYAKAYNNLGFALSRLGKFDEAITSYSEALKNDPNLPTAHNNLGMILAQKGRYDEAVAQYNEALKIDPEYEKAHYNLGLAMVRQEKFEEASAHFSEAIRLKPNDALAHNNLGSVYYKLGRLDDAAREYSAALRIDPSLSQARSNLERIREERGKEK